MNRLNPNDYNIILNRIPPKLFEFDTVALDTEFFGQDKNRLHRPHGTFASLQATWNCKDIYVITDAGLLPAFFEAIDEAKPVWFNAAYDYVQLRDIMPADDELGVSEWLIDRNDLWDCMVAEQVMYSGYYASFSLAACVRRSLGIFLDKSVREGFGKKETKKSKKKIEEDAGPRIMTDEEIRYSALDVVATLMLHHEQVSKISQTDREILEKIDIPFLWTVIDSRGVMFDSVRWIEIAEEKEGRASPLWDTINKSYNVDGKPLNMRSGAQLKAFLKLNGINVKSTQAKELQKFAGKHPVIDAVLAYKPDHKNSSTYGEGWLDYVESDGRIYPAWKMNGAVTGRSTCNNPPMQTIPVRKEKIYRECFVAGEGNTYLIADYSSQEPRIMAYKSQDEKLIGIFERGDDVYIAVGAEVFGETFDKKDKRRGEMKTLVLGLDYGMTPVGLLRKLKENNPSDEQYTEEYAEWLVNTFFEKFPGVKQYIQDQISQAKKLGYVESIFGRKIYVSPYGRAETQAPNFPIQSSAGDAMKLSSSKIRRIWKKRHGYNPIVLQIHDELVCECEVEYAEELEEVMRKAMVSTAESMHVGVKGAVEIDKGPSWASKH